MLVVEVIASLELFHIKYMVPKLSLSHVRSMGIEYLRVKPERFIESNTEHSWAEYLNNMSRQGTWCDALVVQAVADSLNLLRLRDHCDSE